VLPPVITTEFLSISLLCKMIPEIPVQQYAAGSLPVFVTPDGNVLGRPVAVAVTKDGAFMVPSDGANEIWRTSYVGR
jgi:glucose/arabinose dehydrogenase